MLLVKRSPQAYAVFVKRLIQYYFLPTIYVIVVIDPDAFLAVWSVLVVGEDMDATYFPADIASTPGCSLYPVQQWFVKDQIILQMNLLQFFSLYQ